jgi:hypothetical protein
LKQSRGIHPLLRSANLHLTKMLLDERMAGLKKLLSSVPPQGEWQLWAVSEDGPKVQISMASAIASASSNSTPR